MTQTYRTDDFARWGAGQGFNLSPSQVDNNFWDLIQRMIAQEARPDPSAGIAYFEIVGVMMFVHMTDGSVLGPYELPVAIFRSRGAWVAGVVYSKMDTVDINGGLYVVIWDHTSGSTFDPGANDGAGHNYYQLMIQTPGSSLPSGGAAGSSLLKATTADYSAMWGFPDAANVYFTPATGSTLTSSWVADALEELAESGFTGTASDIPYTPSTGSGLTSDNVQDALDEIAEGSSGGGGGGAVGRQTLWIPASAMIPRFSNGPAVGSFETTTNKNMVRTLDFDPTVNEYAQFDIAMPLSWDLGPVMSQVFWSHASTTGGYLVAWRLDAASIDSAYDLDATFTLEPVWNNSVGGVTNRLWSSSESDPLTIDIRELENPTRRIINFRVWRDAPTDSLSIDARLHGVKIFYSTNAATDDEPE